MTLAEYLADTGESCAAFGARCHPPINRITVWRIKLGQHNPGAEKVAAIEKASGYRVRAVDLVRRPPHKVANS